MRVHCVRVIKDATPNGKRSGVTTGEDESATVETLGRQQPSHIGREIDSAKRPVSVECREGRSYGRAAPETHFEDTVPRADSERPSDQAIATSVEEVEHLCHRPCRPAAGMSE
jgi:hypothetical protein